MSAPYVGEIRMFAGNFAPSGWEICDGSLLFISENTALFSLIGTTYGGDGQQTFALPDLRGRIPIHQGQGPALTARVLGESGGVEGVTLIIAPLPRHSHQLQAAEAAASARIPQSSHVVSESQGRIYAAAGGSPAAMAPSAISTTGRAFPHENMQPFLSVNFIISLFGIFPSRS